MKQSYDRKSLFMVVSVLLAVAALIFGAWFSTNTELLSNPHHSQINDSPTSLTANLALLLFIVFLWRFLQQRQRMFLFLATGFLWFATVPQIHRLILMANPQLGTTTLTWKIFPLQLAWFVISLMIFLSAVIRSKFIQGTHLIKSAVVAGLSGLLVAAFGELLSVVVWSPQFVQLPFPLQMQMIWLNFSLVLLFIAGILFVRKFVAVRHGIFAGFAIGSILLMCHCLLLLYFKNITINHPFIVVIAPAVGFSAFLLSHIFDKNLFYESELQLRTSLEKSVLELERSTVEWQTMVQNTAVAVIVLNKDGKITRYNLATEKLFSKPNRIDGSSFRAMVSPDFRAEFESEMKHLLSGRSREFEFNIQIKKDKTSLVHVYAVPYYKRGKKIDGAQLTMQPIDVWRERELQLRKDLEKALNALQEHQDQYRKQEQKWGAEKQAYSSFLRESGEIMLLMDTKGKCNFINQFGQQRTGYNVDQLRKSNLPAFLRDVNQLQRQFGNSVDLSLTGYEERWRTKNGDSILVRWNASLLTDSNGQRFGIAAVGRDITKHRELQHQVETYNQQIAHLIEKRIEQLNRGLNSLSNSLKFYDSASSKYEQTQLLQHLCNTICQTGVGLAAVQFQDGNGRNYWCAAADRGPAKATSMTVTTQHLLKPTFLETGKRVGQSYFFGENQIPKQTQQMYSQISLRLPKIHAPTNLIVTPVASRGVRFGLLFAFNINLKETTLETFVVLLEIFVKTTAFLISSQFELADKRSKIAFLEKEQKNRFTFFSHITHEMRTPLNSMITMLDLIQRSDKETATNVKWDHLQIVQHAADRLLTLVNNILNVVGMESDDTEGMPTLIVLRDFLKKQAETIRPSCNKKNLHLKVIARKSIPEGVFADEESLTSAVENLLSNAVKFTEKGEIVLSAKISQRGQALEISVTDTGVGIARKKQKRIFAEFTRLRVSKEKGTGLGLAIVRRAVEKLGGEIRVKSEEGKGSTFCMIFPLKKVGRIYMLGFLGFQTNEKQETSQPQSAKHKRQIVTRSVKPVLIIDDDADIHSALRFLLEDQGYQVQSATSGSEGIAMARRKKPGLILMDLTMPQMDGFEATQKIKSISSLQSVPVVAMTAKPKSDWRKASRAGCSDWLSKPFRANELAEKVNKWLPVKSSQ